MAIEIAATMALVQGFAVAADSVFKSAKALKDLLKKDGKAPAQNDAVVDQINELLDQTIDLKTKQIELLDAVVSFRAEKEEFEERVRAFDDFEQRAAHFSLIEVRDNSYAYIDRNEEGGLASKRLYCQPCFTDRRISLLQYFTSNGMTNVLKCPKCEFRLRGMPQQFSGPQAKIIK